MTAALAPLPDLLGTSPADLLGDCDRRDSTPDEARQRAERLRGGIVGYAQMRQDIADAFAGRDWIALGYDSWATYVEGEFGGLLAQLGRGERRQAVADLRGQGMSTRQIADATGVSDMQVRRDLAQVRPDVAPATVTGSDGKQHPAARPASTPAPAAPVPPDTQEPAPTPAPTEALISAVLEALDGHGQLGRSAAEVWAKVPNGAGFVQIQPAIDELVRRGRVTAGPVIRGTARWLLTPESGDVPSTAPVGSGSGEAVAPAREDGTTASPDPLVAAVALVGLSNDERTDLVEKALTPPPVDDSPRRELAEDIARDSERRAAVASIRSVLTYLTSRVLEPAAVARQYLIALDEFTAADLRFAAETMAALADLKEQ